MKQSLLYPPVSTRYDDLTTSLDILICVITEAKALYLSIPITSGRRLIDWQMSKRALLDAARSNYQSELEDNVIRPNREHVKEVVERLRQAETLPVIDPSAVADLPGWNQSDYRFFWGQVIERYAAKVIFVEGWQYSNGCTYEFLIAHRHSKPAYDEVGNSIPLHEGIALIQTALAEMRECFLPTEFIEAVLVDLSQLASLEITSGRD